VVAGSDRALYLEIRDDTIVTGRKRWLFDDHVELWLAGFLPGGGPGCGGSWALPGASRGGCHGSTRDCCENGGIA